MKLPWLSSDDKHWARRRQRFLLAHLAVVLALTGAFYLLTALGPENDPNIGAGLIALPLLPLGFPWSIPFAIDPYRFDDLSQVVWSLAAFGPALANVLLHALLLAVAAMVRRRNG